MMKNQEKYAKVSFLDFLYIYIHFWWILFLTVRPDGACHSCQDQQTHLARQNLILAGIHTHLVSFICLYSISLL